MGNKYQGLAVDRVVLLEAMKAAKDAGELRRLQSVHLRDVCGLTPEQIASATQFSVSYIKHLHSAYRRGGVEALRSKGKGGRYHAHLTREEEDAFIAPFIEPAKRGGILEVGIIHRALEERLGRPIRRQITYQLLHRHDWRKIMPRRRHPKADIQAQEAFKKTGVPPLQKRNRRPKSPENH